MQPKPADLFELRTPRVFDGVTFDRGAGERAQRFQKLNQPERTSAPTHQGLNEKRSHEHVDRAGDGIVAVFDAHFGNDVLQYGPWVIFGIVVELLPKEIETVIVFAGERLGLERKFVRESPGFSYLLPT
jgi:hypothetical protein